MDQWLVSPPPPLTKHLRLQHTGARKCTKFPRYKHTHTYIRVYSKVTRICWVLVLVTVYKKSKLSGVTHSLGFSSGTGSTNWMRSSFLTGNRGSATTMFEGGWVILSLLGTFALPTFLLFACLHLKVGHNCWCVYICEHGCAWRDGIHVVLLYVSLKALKMICTLHMF